jgi:hypothetical protein
MFSDYPTRILYGKDDQLLIGQHQSSWLGRTFQSGWLVVTPHQSYHPAPVYPVQRMNDVVSIQDCQQTFYGSRRVARPWLNVLPQDAPSVLNGTHYRILVGISHNGHALQRIGHLSRGRGIGSGATLSRGQEIVDRAPACGVPSEGRGWVEHLSTLRLMACKVAMRANSTGHMFGGAR